MCVWKSKALKRRHFAGVVCSREPFKMRIARQFGISQSDVRKALATEGRDRKSGR
jgi:hypothetical protein